MTRFARAKGSKSSNERLPNEATPWHIMKQQLEDSAAAKNFQPQKTKNAKQLLKEKDDPFYCDSTGNVNNDWAEFERPKKKNTDGVREKVESKSDVQSKNKKQKSKDTAITNRNSQDSANDHSEPAGSVSPAFVKKTKKRKSDATESLKPIPEPLQNSESVNTGEMEPKKKKKKKLKEKKIDTEVESTEATQSGEEKKDKENEKAEKGSEVTSLKMSKRQKRNLKKRIKTASEEANANTNGEKAEAPVETASKGFDTAGNDWSTDVKFGKPQKPSCNSKPPPSTDPRPRDRILNNTLDGKVVKRKPPKVRDDKEHKRRKPDPGVIKCTINGMDLEIVKYDGFPVKKEDAERLKDLRKQMVLKGIPKSEIDAAMKLERRKAEKALARVRKQVCFHCRKAGHNLSDCPELGQGEAVTGICFKCGSTEHTHFECKVIKKQEYGFASCFICREQGHIAKQCPDNPKGLYPQGGACKICGDVTHLKKDCPDLTKEKEESAMTLGTIAENTLEALDEDASAAKRSFNEDSKKHKSKVVKF